MYTRYVSTLFMFKKSMYIGNLIVPIQKDLLTFLVHAEERTIL